VLSRVSVSECDRLYFSYLETSKHDRKLKDSVQEEGNFL